MNFIVFILVYPFIRLLSLLPMRLLYLISDFFYLFLYYVVGYRKKVVKKNILLVFPDKKEKEVINISKKFYKHLTDLVFESVKAFSISEKEIKKRYTYKNIEIINNLYERGKSIALVGSHHNNWELSFGLPLHTKINCFGAYTKIKNPYFEKVIKKSRKKFGFDGVPTFEFKKTIQNRAENNIQSLYILLSDQSPKVAKTEYWTNFLNQFVPVHTGAETLAKKYDFSIVNMNIKKIKRGYYQAEFQLISDDVKSSKDYELTEKYLNLTQKHIYKQPEFYLWSHNRFKHINKYKIWQENYDPKKSF